MSCKKGVYEKTPSIEKKPKTVLTSVYFNPIPAHPSRTDRRYKSIRFPPHYERPSCAHSRVLTQRLEACTRSRRVQCPFRTFRIAGVLVNIPQRPGRPKQMFTDVDYALFGTNSYRRHGTGYNMGIGTRVDIISILWLTSSCRLCARSSQIHSHPNAPKKYNFNEPKLDGVVSFITEFLWPILQLHHQTLITIEYQSTRQEESNEPKLDGLRRLITEFLWPPSSSIIRR
ncbi:hypothetical protein EVAR_40224_1 [Eumeta japonica]|uniref:Uncharacterized protein n=1 Tax=Eumeta variegata TaxID=151549 RepID=A0A4C1X9W6_EUMVA|nr:hypothetical protein EVAR_40224_1 [Eumeta japonica]